MLILICYFNSLNNGSALGLNKREEVRKIIFLVSFSFLILKLIYYHGCFMVFSLKNLVQLISACMTSDLILPRLSGVAQPRCYGFEGHLIKISNRFFYCCASVINFMFKNVASRSCIHKKPMLSPSALMEILLSHQAHSHVVKIDQTL